MDLHRPAVIVALLTPYDERGELDQTALRAHVDDLVAAGVGGLMPCGTTGEQACLGDDEVAAVIRATVAAADGRVPVVAHVGRPGTAPTLALARRALADGAAAVSAVVPYYYALSDDQVRAHYGALVDGVDAPVLGYTIPSHTHRELEPGLLERLVADGLAGLKDSAKSIERHREYAAVARAAEGPFALYDGSAPLVLDALREGSAGAVLAIANLHPELCAALVRAHAEGRPDEAQRLQAELTECEHEVLGADVLGALKRGVAERLAARGAPPYGTTLRSPLGAAGLVPAAR
jgi:dihydrodipicolinate synthase/N-acetylneuraminate lyase